MYHFKHQNFSFAQSLISISLSIFYFVDHHSHLFLLFIVRLKTMLFYLLKMESQIIKFLLLSETFKQVGSILIRMRY